MDFRIQHSSNLKPIDSLTSLRFFAAFMVLFSHLPLSLLNDHSSIPNAFLKFRGQGFIGVTFFFILSGFILTYKYLSLIQHREINLKTFMFLRIAKLYPTHLLTFFLSLPIIVLAQEYNLHSKLFYGLYFLSSGTFNLLLMHSLFPLSSIYWSFNSISWSISTELVFYFFGFFLFAAKVKNLTQLILTQLCLLSGLVFVVFYFQFPYNLSLWLLYINPISRLFDFMIGIVLARLYLKYFHQNKMTTQVKISKIILFTSLELICMLVLGFFLFCSNLYSIPELLVRDLFYVIPFTLLIFIFALEKGLISKVLQWPLLVFLGEVSFAIYMFHQLINRYLILIKDLYHINLTNISYAALLFSLTSIALTLLVSSLSFLYYEKRMNHFLRTKFFDRHQNSLQNPLTTLATKTSPL